MEFVTAKQNRVTAKREKKPMISAISKRNSIVVSPADLHTILQPAQTEIMFFASEKSLMSYRRMLYTINAQGTFQYRTLRNPKDHRELIVWRMM